jgi:hypothetical protein
MKPVLYKIKTFDSTKDNVFKFVWEGNQSFGNVCTIRDNVTNAIVYSQSEASMRLEHNIVSNTLKNGTWYNVVVASIDVNGNISDYSDPMVFYCLSTPILFFTNIEPNIIIRNASYRISMSYSQAENEPLESYEISLYDNSKNLIQTSGVVYSSVNLEYTLTSLEDNQTYYVRGTCYTLNGMDGETDYIPISVNYTQPNYYSLLTLENVKNNGYIKLQSNIRAVECFVDGTPIFIDGEYIDARNNIITINKDYALDNDYVIRFSGYDLKTGLIMQIGNIEIYLVKENDLSYLELYSPILKTNYYCQSNRLEKLTATEEVDIVIIKKKGLFSISFNRK